MQIRLWWEALERHKKSREDLLIIKTEDLKTNRTQVLNSVLDFLDLSPWEYEESHNVASGYEPMKAATRFQLEEFFIPFNLQLEELLQRPTWEY